VRQYGWSGEKASGFLGRMTNDCLRFKPTVATTCYGMNDHEYKPYEQRIGDTYREKQTAIVDSFKGNGVRVVLGSAGCVGKVPGWVKTATGTVEDLNLNLCELRNIDIEIAEAEKVRFADVFWPMLAASYNAPLHYGTNYMITGKDGVHPGWAGHTIMAYAFLKAMGLDGEIGTFTVDLAAGKAKLSTGHKLVSTKDGVFEIRSSRYPFSVEGEVTSDDSIRSGTSLVPFNQTLNRLMLVARGGKATSYRVTWNGEAHSYSAAQLADGINLATEYPINPFTGAFKSVDEAVAAKQAFEKKQIKQVFHDLFNGKFKSADDIKDADLKELYGKRDAEGKLDKDAIIAWTESKHALLDDAVHKAFVPVTHTIKIEAE
jgi:lysophospholipase L1-like esterase